MHERLRHGTTRADGDVGVVAVELELDRRVTNGLLQVIKTTARRDADGGEREEQRHEARRDASARLDDGAVEARWLASHCIPVRLARLAGARTGTCSVGGCGHIGVSCGVTNGDITSQHHRGVRPYGVKVSVNVRPQRLPGLVEEARDCLLRARRRPGEAHHGPQRRHHGGVAAILGTARRGRLLADRQVVHRRVAGDGVAAGTPRAKTRLKGSRAHTKTQLYSLFNPPACILRISTLGFG